MMELLIPLDSRSKNHCMNRFTPHICAEIRSGALKAGDRLPSTRVLAEHLKVSRSTTQMAYDQLLAEDIWKPGRAAAILSVIWRNWWRPGLPALWRWKRLRSRMQGGVWIFLREALIWTAFLIMSGES